MGMCRLLWAFEIRQKLDATGKPIPIERDAIVPALVTGPQPFESVVSSISPWTVLTAFLCSRCEIKPRDAARKAMIMAAWTKNQEELDDEGHFNDRFFDRFRKEVAADVEEK